MTIIYSNIFMYIISCYMVYKMYNIKCNKSITLNNNIIYSIFLNVFKKHSFLYKNIIYRIMRYKCKCCNYKTDLLSNFNRHNESKSHINKKICINNKSNIENIEIANVDNKILIENLLLKQKVKFLEEKTVLIEEKKQIESKLIRAEMESKLIKEKTENKLLHKQSKKEKKLFNEHKKELLKSKDVQIDLVQHNNIESARHAYSEGKMNALTFVSLCYKKTSIMPTIPMDSDYVVADVKSDKEIKYWIEQKPDFADEYIAERLLHIYDNKGFINYITNIVVKAYKKYDPAEQTFWASDVSRLIYIVRSTFNQKDEWVYDKKGVIIKESIIDPLLDEVYNIIVKYRKYMEDRYLHSLIEEENDYYMKKLSILKIVDKLIDDFKNRQSIKNQIIRVLAPKFFLDRDVNKDKKLIEDQKQKIEKQKQLEYKPPKIENNTIFDKIKNKKLEESKQLSEDSENTEDFLNDPRVKAKMEREKKLLNNKKIGNSSESEEKPKLKISTKKKK
jgi:hypothetical protein